MELRQRTSSTLATAALALMALGGCSDSTGVGAGEQVSLNFRVGLPGSGAALSSAAGPAAVGPSTVAGPPMTLEGTNGTLTIDEILIIINEVELHRADPSCDSSSGSSDDSLGSLDDCDEFEAGPRFLDLPLDGEPIEAVTAVIPAGVYKELDFEIEDLEDDETGPGQAALIAALRSEILQQVSDWPRKASAMVTGTFQPTSGDPVDFRVFLEAEVEIEFPLIPNLVIDDAGGSNRDLTVDVRPDIWFSNPDGSLVELQLYDYDTTGQLLEFEVEMEDGFTEIEYDD